MTIQTGYFIADKAAIKTLTSVQRSNGYTRASYSGTDSSPDAEWYMFIAASSAGADDDSVLMPNDNPPTGRWHKYAANRAGVGGGASNLVMTSSGNPPTADPPTQSPTSGVMYIHLQIQAGYGSTTFSYWIGIDSTGTLGNNGWVFVKND
ncbi:hypothetical protein [Nostoc sp.]